MPFNSRDLWVVLKAQDMASRALNMYSRSVRSAGDATRLAQIEAEKGSRRAAMASLEQQKAQNAAALAMGRVNGMTREQRNGIAASTAAIKAQQAGLKGEIAALDAEAHSIRGASAAAQQHAVRQRALASNLRAAGQSAYTASFAMTALGVVGALAVGNLVKTATEYNRTVALTKTQVTGFRVTLSELSNVGLQVARTFGVPFESIQKAMYDIFSSTDANMKQATMLVNQFAKSAIAGQVSVQDTATVTMQIMNAFHMPLESVNKVLDVQFQLVRKGVGTYAQFASVIGRAVPSTVRAGQNIETLAGGLAFLTRNGLSAAMSAASMARAMDAISNPKSVKNIEQLGVKVRDAHGKFLPLVDILHGLRDALMKLPPADRVAKLQEIFKGSGGTIQARRFLDLVLLMPGALEQFTGFVNDMHRSAGSMNDAYKTMADTVAVKTELMKNKWTVAKVELGNALIPVVLQFLDVVNRLFAAYDRLSPKQKTFIADLLAIAAGVLLIAGPLVGLVGMFLTFAAAAATLGIGLGEIVGVIALVGGGFLAIGAAVVTAYQKSKPFRDWISTLARYARAAWDDIQKFAKGVKASFDTYLAPAFANLKKLWDEKIVPILEHMTRLFGPDILSNLSDMLNKVKGVADQGFKYLAAAINKFLIPAINTLIDFYHRHQKGIDKAIGGLIILAKWIGVIAGSAVIGLLVGALLLLIGTISLLIRIFVSLGDRIANVIKFFSDASAWADRTNEHIKNFYKSVGRALSDVIAFIRRFPGLAQNALSSLGSRLRGIASSAMATMRAIITGGINAVVSFFAGLPGRASAAISSIIGRIRAIFSSMRSAAIAVVSAAIGSLVGLMAGMPGRAAAQASRLPGAIRRAVGNLGGVLVSAGEDLVRGLISGIGHMLGAAGNAGAAVGHAAAAAARAALHLGSPSRLFAYYGKMSVAGYVQGVAQSLPYLTANMNKITQGIELPNTIYNSGGVSAGAASGSMSKNVTVNVYTNEIRPEYHAARMGQLLAGRV